MNEKCYFASLVLIYWVDFFFFNFKKMSDVEIQWDRVGGERRVYVHKNPIYF
jgi:hypothetical protein